MHWITLAMYVIVLLIWIGMLVGFLRAGRDATRSARSNLIYMTLILAALTVLQLYGLSR